MCAPCANTIQHHSRHPLKGRLIQDGPCFTWHPLCQEASFLPPSNQSGPPGPGEAMPGYDWLMGCCCGESQEMHVRLAYQTGMIRYGYSPNMVGTKLNSLGGY